jgi:hypothetical protein
METDPRTLDVTHLTLSYTFFPVEDDEDDTRTEEEKDAQSGVRIHGSGTMPVFGTTPTGTSTPIEATPAVPNSAPNSK